MSTFAQVVRSCSSFQQRNWIAGNIASHSKYIYVYINPVMHYCSNLWSPANQTQEKLLSRNIRTTTRMLLRSPRNVNDTNYISFDDRLRWLQILSDKNKRVISLILLTRKLYKGEIDTPSANIVQNARISEEQEISIQNHRFTLVCYWPTNIVMQYFAKCACINLVT